MTTGAEGRRVTLDGGVEARLGGSSVMRIDRGDARVEEGAVRFSVPTRRPGHPFVVRAQQYRVVVLGTKFGVAVRGDKQVDVDVAEGVVEVWSDVAPARELRAALPHALRLARLARHESWLRATPPMSPAERADWGMAASAWLARVPDPPLLTSAAS